MPKVPSSRHFSSTGYISQTDLRAKHRKNDHSDKRPAINRLINDPDLSAMQRLKDFLVPYDYEQIYISAVIKKKISVLKALDRYENVVKPFDHFENSNLNDEKKLNLLKSRMFQFSESQDVEFFDFYLQTLQNLGYSIEDEDMISCLVNSAQFAKSDSVVYFYKHLKNPQEYMKQILILLTELPYMREKRGGQFSFSSSSNSAEIIVKDLLNVVPNILSTEESSWLKLIHKHIKNPEDSQAMALYLHKIFKQERVQDLERHEADAQTKPKSMRI